MIRVRKNPDAYFITIDRHTLTQVGKSGVMKDEAVVLRLATLIELTTKSPVKVWRAYTLTGA